MLIQCRQLQMEGKLCMPEDIRYALTPLYIRGYIGLRKTFIKNKELMTVFITPAGLTCLEVLKNVKKDLQSNLMPLSTYALHTGILLN
jgi:hypothetical protein